MNVVVTVKYVPNPQGVQELGPDNLVIRTGVEGALDPGDEFGVEAALQIAEATGGEVTVVSMGPDEAIAAVQRGLAMGAHRGVLVTDDSLRGSDTLATARVLAAAIKRSPFDVIITGVESTDGYTGTLPQTLAELLGLPSLTFARKLEIDGTMAKIERQTETGYATAECALPVLVTLTAGANEPRYPNLKGIMGAKSKPQEKLTLADLGLTAEDVAPSQTISSISTATEKAAGEVIVAEDAASAAAKIADLLQEAKVI